MAGPYQLGNMVAQYGPLLQQLPANIGAMNPGALAQAGPFLTDLKPNLGSMNFSALANSGQLGPNVPPSLAEQVAALASKNPTGAVSNVADKAYDMLPSIGSEGGSIASRIAGLQAAKAGGASPLQLLLGEGEGMAGTALTKGALLRGGGYGIAGMMGGNLLDSLDLGGHNSNWDRGLSGAARGAGIGAGIGSVVPVIGTGLGALLGGGAGALINIFGPKGKSDQQKAAEQNAKLSDLMSMSGIDPSTQQDLQLSYALNLKLAGTDKKAQAAATQQYQQSILQQVALDQQQRAQDRQQQSKMAAIFGLQNAIGQSMAPSLQQFADGQNYISTTLASTAAGMQDGAMKQAIMDTAARAAQNGGNMTKAYATEANAIPYDYAMQLMTGSPQNSQQAQHAAALQALIASRSNSAVARAATK